MINAASTADQAAGWQSVALADIASKQIITAPALHVWWWPESLQPAAPTRRLRTDAILRRLLARYLPVDPAELQFGRESKGRPFLLDYAAPDFNFSDTRGGCVLAVTVDGRVGIDIERCDRILPVDQLATRWFSPEEAKALRELDAEAARRAFLRLWTAKEASCKATGTGIFGHLASWRFNIGADNAPPHPLAMPFEVGSSDAWRFHRLAPAGSHTVALVCRDISVNPQTYAVVA